MNEFFSIFITIAGFVIGLGAVTVVDLHGFLGRRSSYWTEKDHYKFSTFFCGVVGVVNPGLL